MSLPAEADFLNNVLPEWLPERLGIDEPRLIVIASLAGHGAKTAQLTGARECALAGRRTIVIGEATEIGSEAFAVEKDAQGEWREYVASQLVSHSLQADAKIPLVFITDELRSPRDVADAASLVVPTGGNGVSNGELPVCTNLHARDAASAIARLNALLHNAAADGSFRCGYPVPVTVVVTRVERDESAPAGGRIVLIESSDALLGPFRS